MLFKMVSVTFLLDTSAIWFTILTVFETSVSPEIQTAGIDVNIENSQ